MNWFKRYLISCVVAVVFFAGVDAYKQPGGDTHLATIVLASVGWPVFAALVVGGAMGDVAHDMKHGKAG